MQESLHYNSSFFTHLDKGSYTSAKKILPIVNDLFLPKSVIDVGCGSGLWLKVWKEDLKVNDLLGIEGDYVDESIFKLDKMFLKNADLKQKVKLDRKFDLVCSLEVAEHLPEDCADNFIESLVGLGDIILFSAAIKGQLGTYHINEQMPEYWAKKFADKNFIAVDYIRPQIWNDQNIQYWYRQNIILYINSNVLKSIPLLNDYAKYTDINFLTRIHPEKYFSYLNENLKLQTLHGFLLNKYKGLKKSFLNR